MTAGRVQAFLEGEGVDGQGRTLFDMLAFDDATIERRHDFIQWLFPLDQPSAAVPDAPVLTDEEIAPIRDSITAQCALAAATDRMDRFYRGTTLWLAPQDHNHLRITRIIRSLRLLRGDADADAFKAAILHRVEATGAVINARTLAWWRTA